MWPSLFPEQTWLQLTVIIPGSHTLDKTTSGNKMIKERGHSIPPPPPMQFVTSGWRVTRWCTSLRGVLSPLQWWCTGCIVPDTLYWVHCIGYIAQDKGEVPGFRLSAQWAHCRGIYDFSPHPKYTCFALQCPENITSGIVSNCLLARATFWKMMDDD